VIKVEPRQPLASRQNNVNGRPIAPVPHRANVKPTMPTVAQEDEEEYDDMEVDRTTIAHNVDLKVEEDHLLDVESGDEVDDEEEEEEDEEAGEMGGVDDENWTLLSPADEARAAEELESVRMHFDDEIDLFDTTMVAEYADDIFAHMEAMELSVMPNPKYMDFQTEIEW